MTEEVLQTAVVEIGDCCEKCHCFLPTDENQGVCRSKPPVPAIVDGQVVSFQPSVRRHGWCLEFSPDQSQLRFAGGNNSH